MAESFLQNAQLTGLDRAARRTEILRAKQAAALEVRIAELEDLTTPTAWTDVTFQNSWVNYGGGFQSVQYRKVGDLVHVRGLAKDGTIGFVPAFTLPVGFRPPAGMQYTTYRGGSAVLNSVNTDGTVYPVFGVNTAHWFDFMFSVTE